MELLHNFCISTGFILMLTMSCMFTSASPAPCEMAMSVKISSPQLLSNESVLDQTSHITYPPGTYWSLVDQGVTTYRGCPCKIDGRPCLRKCCPLGEMLRNRKCVPHNTTFVVNVTDNGKNFQVVEGGKHFSLIVGLITCNNSTHLRKRLNQNDLFKYGIYIDSTDGRLVHPKETYSLYYGPDSYCMEYFHDKSAHLQLICESISSKDFRLVIYPIFMAISIVFLLLTLAVYTNTPELRNLHGKCLMCQIVSLILAYVFLCVSQVEGINNIARSACVATAFIIQFSFLSTFFWLNVMCLEIFLAFSGMKAMSGFIREKEKKKFILYSLYAWGCPLIMLIISMVMEYYPGIPDYYRKPRFGETQCWFKNKIDGLVFFYGLQSVLITSNIIMFGITAFKIVKLSKQADVLRKEGCRSSDEQKENRHRFQLYLKLLVVMGVSWIMDLISWALSAKHIIMYLADVFLSLQGVFIFLIFVCKDKILNTLLEKFFPRYAEKRKQTAHSMKKLRGAGSSTASKSTVSGGYTAHATENVELNSMGSHYPENTDA